MTAPAGAAVTLLGARHDVLGPAARAALVRRRTSLLPAGTAVVAPAVHPGRLDEEVEPGNAELVVSPAALCTADDLAATLASVRRALAPGGRLAFVEHVGRPGWGGVAHAVADRVWSRLPGGCHVDRDLPAELRRAGFVIHRLERFTMSTAVTVLRPWVQGIAAVRGDRP